jgi:hypothetical protein
MIEKCAIAVLQLLYTGTMPQSGFFLKKKPPSEKTGKDICIGKPL